MFKKFSDLTNDQQFAVQLMHPSWGLDKEGPPSSLPH